MFDHRAGVAYATILFLSLGFAASCTTEVDLDAAASPDVVAAKQEALFVFTPCIEKTYGGHGYAFCADLQTWAGARERCRVKGMDLVSIGSSGENSFVLGNAPLGTWIGANDLTTEGQWDWVGTSSPFWNGGPTGTVVPGAYAKWKVGEPQNFLDEDCGMMEALSGSWLDLGCGWFYSYTCEAERDLCPSDPAKYSPGACGCGRADTDGDGDGTPNCIDQCPLDASHTEAGDCGCPSSPRSFGTACDDGVCGGPSTCNGVGVCGTPSTCSPDSNCSFVQTSESTYWFCNNSRTWTDARNRCRTRSGTELVSIGDSTENALIARNIIVPSWIGGNDRDSEGRFRWAERNTDSGMMFWTGTATSGAPVPSALSSWAAGEPDNLGNAEDCIFVSPTDPGVWADGVCSTAWGFVCEQGADLCPTDPAKSAPGICGCGISDADTDGDGTADCKEQCPLDPLRTVPGRCGCVGGPKTAAGTACSDGLCSSNTQCDGNGSCGTIAQCAPDTACTARIRDKHVYWTCTNDRTWTAANTACQTKTRTNLVRIDQANENEWLASVLGADAWIGANDTSAEGTWRWSGTDTHFWTGLASGTPKSMLFSAWRATEPSDGAQDCGMLRRSSVTWDDRVCTETRDFVCETCVRKSCAEQGARCGFINDGCGGTVNCSTELGGCPTGTVCFAGANKCSDSAGDSCRASLKVDTSLSSEDATRKYFAQRAACSDPAMQSCEAFMLGAIQDDLARAANACNTNRITPGAHNTLIRDRNEKARRVISEGCRVFHGDADRDLVPDDSDICLDTPPLTPTLATGCTDPNALPGPDSADMTFMRDKHRYMHDEDCLGMNMDATPVPFSLGTEATGGRTLYFFPIPRPAGCEMFYEMQADVLLPDNSTKSFAIAWNQSESPFVHPGPTSTVSYFRLLPSMPGPRGELAAIAAKDIIYTLRARNGNGDTSFWSGPTHMVRAR
jgi:hypothetical protein